MDSMFIIIQNLFCWLMHTVICESMGTPGQFYIILLIFVAAAAANHY